MLVLVVGDSTAVSRRAGTVQCVGLFSAAVEFYLAAAALVVIVVEDLAAVAVKV